MVGEFIAGAVVENAAILEWKSVWSILATHQMQLANYFAATGKPVRLILNFGEC